MGSLSQFGWNMFFVGWTVNIILDKLAMRDYLTASYHVSMLAFFIFASKYHSSRFEE